MVHLGKNRTQLRAGRRKKKIKKAEEKVIEVEKKICHQMDRLRVKEQICPSFYIDLG